MSPYRESPKVNHDSNNDFQLINSNGLSPENKRGRGMGSPIPSLQEGAWTREGPKFVDGGSRGSVDVFVLEP